MNFYIVFFNFFDLGRATEVEIEGWRFQEENLKKCRFTG
jgi:hypothetical protein